MIGLGVVSACLGTNGCGKTSLYKMVMGLEPITSGSISVLGMDVSNKQNLL